MRLVAKIPARLGRVRSISVQVRYEGAPGTAAVDVTDVMLQPGAPSGVVPNPRDLPIHTGGTRWRNGVVTRSTDEVIIMSNGDLPAPTRVEVSPAGSGAVRVGSYRFGALTGPAWADGAAYAASTGWGHVPVLTARSDGNIPVISDRPVHVSVGWSERS